MPAVARVGRGDDPTLLSPRVEHSLDGGRRQVGAVREDDDRSFDVVRERVEPAAKRRTRPALPLVTARRGGREMPCNKL